MIAVLRLLKGITATISTHVTQQTKLRIAPVALVVTDVSRLSRSSRRAVSSVLHSTCDTARTTFSCTKKHGLDSVSWREATSGILPIVVSIDFVETQI